MDEESRKRLTKFLGERPGLDCSAKVCSKNPQYNSCFHGGKRCEYIIEVCKRTFDTWADYGALVEMLKEKGLWEGFCCYVGNVHFDTKNDLGFLDWLLDLARCNEIATFLKERAE